MPDSIRNDARPTSGEARSRLNLAALVGAVILLVGGCGNLTAGGARGDVSAAVSGDAPDAPEQATPSAAATPSALASPSTTAVIEGEIDATLRVYLETTAGERLPIVENNTPVVVDTQGQSEVELTTVRMPAGSYPRARVVFTHAHADIEEGLVIGGVSVVGRVDVGGSDVDSLVVERPVGIQIEEGSEVQLLVDLNSPAWLVLAEPLLQVGDPDHWIVDAEEFRAAVELRVR